MYPRPRQSPTHHNPLMSKHHISFRPQWARLILASLMCCLILISCSRPTPPNVNIRSAQEYMQLASSASGPAQTHYLLLAADRYLDENQTQNAENILSKLSPNTFSIDQHHNWQLLRARLSLQMGYAQDALAKLQTLQPNALPTLLRIRYYQQMANTQAALNHVAASLNARDLLLHSLPKEDRIATLKSTWQYLHQLRPEQLQQLEQSTDPDAQGWQKLVYIAKQTQWSDAALAQAITAWQQYFPGHPANQLLSNNPQKSLSQNPPQKIGLLLPLSGPYAPAANALRNGFFAAYYANKTATSPTINVINTQTNDIQQGYQQAIAQGNQLVVGPLIKENLQKLIDNSSISVPTIALNQLPDDHNPLLIQFALSPLDEARQVADYAWSDHHQRAIIITNASARGQQIAKVMQTRWQSLGGDVASIWLVHPKSNLSRALQQVLLINQSRARKQHLQSILGRNLRYLPRRRADIDTILLSTTPALARQIQPLLKYYFAGNIPIYATSQIYSGYPNPSLDGDLNGIYFCDAPWVLSPRTLTTPTLNQLSTQIQSLWPQSFRRFRRFYAMGIDAYYLSTHLNRLSILPGLGVAHATGTLTLNEHRIYRSLSWAVFRQGQPQVITHNTLAQVIR